MSGSRAGWGMAVAPHSAGGPADLRIIDQKDPSKPRGIKVPPPYNFVDTLGWSRDGLRLAALLGGEGGSAVSIWDFSRSGQQESVLTWSLDAGLIEAPNLTLGWSSDSSSLVVAAQLKTRPTEPPELHDGDVEPYFASVLWRFSKEGPKPLFFEREGGFFGASYSSNGEVISCCTGTALILFSAGDLSFLQSLESFYTGLRPVPLPGSTPGSETYISSLGFTICHAWSPDGAWLLAGNVGGMRLWEAERLQETER